MTWAAQGVTPDAAGEWRRLSNDEATETRRRAVAELPFAARVEVGVARYDPGPDPAAYPDNVRYYIDDYSIEQEENEAKDAIRSQLEELAGIAEWPGAVQRTATVSGEAAGGPGWAADLDDSGRSACLLPAGDAGNGRGRAARARVTAIKASYDA
jgi:hypothetical protein